jgi:hypothetical protein
MKAAIEVENRAEGDRIKRALGDEATRAFVNTMGALLPLAPKARDRVLRFVTETLEDGDGQASETR